LVIPIPLPSTNSSFSLTIPSCIPTFLLCIVSRILFPRHLPGHSTC
jgi:hypothetical protein